MVPAPVAIGMTVCDYVIVEERTRKVSTIGHFYRLRAVQLPLSPKPFCVFAWLTDGHGFGATDLVINRLDSGKRIKTFSATFHFPHRTAIVPILFRINDFAFPGLGHYGLSLHVDSAFIAQSRLEVFKAEEPS